MIKYKKEMMEWTVSIEVICDKCKKTFDCKKDGMEIQEFVYVRNLGGDESLFGNGKSINYDICQYCFHNFIREE